MIQAFDYLSVTLSRPAEVCLPRHFHAVLCHDAVVVGQAKPAGCEMDQKYSCWLAHWHLDRNHNLREDP